MQVIQAQGHTLPEMAWRLSRVRGKRVPDRTLRWWISELCLEPNPLGLFEDSDLAVLTSLVLFLKRSRSIVKFKQLLLQEIETNGTESRSA